MIVSADTKIYNDMVVMQYQRFLHFAKEDEDRVHTSYLKVLDRINRMPFTAHTAQELIQKLIIYVKTTIYNDFKTSYTSSKPVVQVGNDAEEVLQIGLNEANNDKEFHNQVQYATQKLFEYIKKNYPEDWQYTFRCYYLYDEQGKKITYKKLSEITGYSISKCCNIIQAIKTDIRENLEDYINGTN